MVTKLPIADSKKGFSLIEILIVVLIFGLVATVVTGAIIANIKGVGLGRRKATATQIANEKMEVLRNMPYDDLATQNGDIYPPGTILDEEEIIREGFTFTVLTQIKYYDDPFDGDALGTIQGKPVDLYPYDYKKAEITVKLKNTNVVLASAVSNIGARAAETPSDTGIILVKVLDANGLPVAGATVTLINNEAVPPVNIITTTDNNGIVMIPKLPEDTQNKYQIVATKDGMSTDQTYERTAQNPNAVQPNVDVLIQQVTSQTLTIDTLSTMNITVVDTAGNPISGLSLEVKGDKLIYFNPETAKYDQTHVTNAQGQINLTNMEWDGYSLTPTEATNRICATDPYQKVTLTPNSTLNVKLTVTTNANYPKITAVSPLSDNNNGSYDLIISGEKLDTGLTAILKKTGEPNITASAVQTQGNGNEATATFDLAGQNTGIRDLEITNGVGTCKQENAFTITAP